jgi:hypothetical protein
MSETNDTLHTATSAETTANQQAEGADGSVSQQQTASTETTDKLLAGKFRSVEDLERAYAEAQKLIGRKTVDAAEAAKVLGSANESGSATTGGQQVAPQSRAEGQQVAQAAGGDELEQWFTKTAQTYGTARALTLLTQHTAQQSAQAMLAQTLQPLNDQMASDQQTRNQERLESAIDRLAKEHEDFDVLLPDMKTFLDEHPRYRKELAEASTIRDKQEVLDVVYSRVKTTKGKNAAAASKAAGAVEQRQRDQMKAAAVTNGTGTRNSDGDVSLEDQFKARLRAAGGPKSNVF